MRGNSLAKGAVLAVAIVLLLLPIAAACARAPSKAPTPSAGPPIKLGVPMDLTGSMGPIGIPTVAAIQLAVDEINAQGGVLGRKFEIIKRDNQSKPDEGIRVANDLIVNEKVDFLVGTISSAVALSISGVAKENKKLYIVGNPRTTVLTFEKGHRYLVQMAPPTIVAARNIAIYMSKQPWKKVFTIGSDFEYSQTITKQFIEHLKKLKPEVEIIGQSWPPLTVVDMSPYITQVIQAKPDAVFEAVVGASTVSLLKQGKGYGVFDKFPWVNVGSYSTEARQALGKEGVVGLTGSIAYEITSDNPRNKAFVKALYEKTGIYPSHANAMHYEAVYFLADAIKKAGTTDTEKVINAFEGLTRDTVVGPVTVRPYDHQAIWPEFMGIYKFVPEYPHVIFQPFAEQPPKDQIFPSVAEVKKARGE